MRATLFAFAITLLSSCGNGSVGTQRAPAPHKPPTAPAEELAKAKASEGACTGDVSPAAFLCNHQERCAQQNLLGPMGLDAFLCALMAQPTGAQEAQTMSDVIARLPFRFRKNLTFKHGVKHGLLRGHAMETKDLTTTATLERPRAVMWDEDTGFTISFNGGPVEHSDEDQRSERELHMMAFGKESESFSFWSVDLPIRSKNGVWQLHPTQPEDAKANCRRCHGEESRPIWAMYPDWPGVFGSDTDELSKKNSHQGFERDALARFRSCVSTASPPDTSCAKTGLVQGDRHHRYATLFDARMEEGLSAEFQRVDKVAIRRYLAERAKGDARRKPQYRLTPEAMGALRGGDVELRAWLGLTLHEHFPYRPNHELQKSEASRALFHRPNLRLGALYNRLNSRRVMALMRKSPIYEPFKTLITFTLMDCSWRPSDAAAREVVLGALRDAAGAKLSAAKMVLPTRDSNGKILYPALIASLGLSLRDVDIRFSHPNARFDSFDSDYNTPTLAATAMDLGYIAYGPRDNNQASGSALYFNSYFDGSASLDELLVAQLLEELGGKYSGLYKLNSFDFKFSDVASRFELDKVLFAKMDRLSRWFPLPYPKHLKAIHNRQAFLRKRGGTYPFRDQHTAVCGQLRDELVAGAQN